MSPREEYAARVMAATYAQLAGEPFGLTMGEVASLTDWQIATIYHHGRDEHGQVEVPEPPAANPEAEFLSVCLALGMSLADAARGLEEQRERRAARERGA